MFPALALRQSDKISSGLQTNEGFSFEKKTVTLAPRRRGRETRKLKIKRIHKDQISTLRWQSPNAQDVCFVMFLRVEIWQFISLSDIKLS